MANKTGNTRKMLLNFDVELEKKLIEYSDANYMTKTAVIHQAVAAFLASKSGAENAEVIAALREHEAPKYAHLVNKKPKGYDGRYTYKKLTYFGLPIDLQMEFVSKRMDIDLYSSRDQVMAAIMESRKPKSA